MTIFRYFTVYGPAGRPDMSMFRFTQWINEGKPVRLFGTGDQTRGFTYVDDIARGTILGLKPIGFEILNLGGHETISINQMIKILEQMLGREANIEREPAHPADMLANWADVSKANAYWAGSQRLIWNTECRILLTGIWQNMTGHVISIRYEDYTRNIADLAEGSIAPAGNKEFRLSL